jgi:hypothetical protein
MQEYLRNGQNFPALNDSGRSVLCRRLKPVLISGLDAELNLGSTQKRSGQTDYQTRWPPRYLPIRSSTEAVMTRTPVRMVGSGCGMK